MIGEEEKLDARRAYVLRHPERVRESKRKWREANRQRQIEIQRQWRKDNPEKAAASTRAWREANPDRMKSLVRNYRARKRSAEGTHTVEDIDRIRKHQNDRCAACRVPLKGGGHVDHIIPLNGGGSNAPSNLQLLCGSCNHSKSDRDPIEFMQSRGKLL